MAIFYFDGDQTLWDFQAMMRRAMAHTIDELRRLRPDASGDLSVEAFVADREHVTERLRGKVTNLEQLRLEAFRYSLRRLHLADDQLDNDQLDNDHLADDHLADHLNALYLRRRFSEVDLFDDVLPVLEVLRQHHHVGLLSNGNSYPHRLGLENLFQSTVLSQDHGIEKPDPRIFDIASTLLPGEPRIMVGDSLANDVAGAQAAGWAGVWLNREEAVTPEGVVPDLVIHTLHDLLPFAAAL
jgi:HAD superfamily hydrolase (TIGR01549 family)